MGVHPRGNVSSEDGIPQKSGEVVIAEELRTLNQKHFLHPTSPVKTENEPAFIFTEAKGVSDKLKRHTLVCLSVSFCYV